MVDLPRSVAVAKDHNVGCCIADAGSSAGARPWGHANDVRQQYAPPVDGQALLGWQRAGVIVDVATHCIHWCTDALLHALDDGVVPTVVANVACVKDSIHVGEGWFQILVDEVVQYCDAVISLPATSSYTPCVSETSPIRTPSDLLRSSTSSNFMFTWYIGYPSSTLSSLCSTHLL